MKKRFSLPAEPHCRQDHCQSPALDRPPLGRHAGFRSAFVSGTRPCGYSPLRALLPTLLGLALLCLVAGCRTSSMDRAVQDMSAAEKSMLTKLSTITKGMSRAQVAEILGEPTKTWKHQWHYAVNQRVVNSTTTHTTSKYVFSGPSGTKVMPGTTTQIPTSTVALDSVATIFFDGDSVERVRFVSVGTTGFWLDVLK